MRDLRLKSFSIVLGFALGLFGFVYCSAALAHPSDAYRSALQKWVSDSPEGQQEFRSSVKRRLLLIRFSNESDIISFYNSIFQEDLSPDQIAELAGWAFSHLEISLQLNPELRFSQEGTKKLFGLRRKFEQATGHKFGKAFDKLSFRAYRSLFYRFLRTGLHVSSDYSKLLSESDFPRREEWAEFTASLAKDGLDDFFKKGPNKEDLRQLVGLLSRVKDPVSARQDFFDQLLLLAFQKMKNSSSPHQRKLGRFLLGQNLDLETTALISILASHDHFKSEQETLLILEDLASLLSGDDVWNRELISGLFLRYIAILQEAARGSYSPFGVYRVLEYPERLMRRQIEHLDEISLSASYRTREPYSMGRLFEQIESFPYDPATLFGDRYSMVRAIEKTARERLLKAEDPKSFLKLAFFEVFPTLDMKEAKWNAMMDSVAYFVAMQPSFSEMINLLAYVPGAHRQLLRSEMLAISEDPQNSLLTLPKKMILFLSRVRILTKQSGSTEGDHPTHRLDEARAQLFASYLLFNLFRQAQTIEKADLDLLNQFLGPDLYSKLVISSDPKSDQKVSVYARDFWGSPHLPRILSLVRSCAQGLGLLSRRPSPTLK